MEKRSGATLTCSDSLLTDLHKSVRKTYLSLSRDGRSRERPVILWSHVQEGKMTPMGVFSEHDYQIFAGVITQIKVPLVSMIHSHNSWLYVENSERSTERVVL